MDIVASGITQKMQKYLHSASYLAWGARNLPSICPGKSNLLHMLFLIIVNCHTELLMKVIWREILLIPSFYSSKTAHKWFIWENQIEFILYKICNYPHKHSKKILMSLDRSFSLSLLQDCLSVCTVKERKKCHQIQGGSALQLSTTHFTFSVTWVDCN